GARLGLLMVGVRASTRMRPWEWRLLLATGGRPGTSAPAATPSASRNLGVVSRGKSWSEAPHLLWSMAAGGFVKRLLQEPSTVRRPYDVIRSGTWFGPGPTKVPHGSDAVRVFACLSAIFIC